MTTSSTAQSPATNTETSEAVRTQVVLDTSALVADPSACTAFPGQDVVIPLTVIEELDGLKSRTGEVGFMARSALRNLEAARLAAGGTLAGASPVGHDSTIRVAINGVNKHLIVEHGLDADKPDNRIIGAALGLVGGAPVVVVSNDAAFRVKAAHLGLTALEHQASTGFDPGVGWVQIEVDNAVIESVFAKDSVARAALPVEVNAALPRGNGFAILKAGTSSALVRVRPHVVEKRTGPTPTAWGLKPRSKEQRFALELLLDPTVPVVALDGPAGCGKSILAYAAGLEQVVEKSTFERLSVFKPLVAVGREEVGFLPGDLREKTGPYFASLYDSITALTERRSSKDAEQLVEEFVEQRKLTMEPVTFLRGRSLASAFILVDESQSLERNVLKTILTRVSEGTKIVFTGDVSQVDNPFASPSNNALTALIEAFDGHELFGHIRLTTCERSPVASMAADRL